MQKIPTSITGINTKIKTKIKKNIKIYINRIKKPFIIYNKKIKDISNYFNILYNIYLINIFQFSYIINKNISDYLNNLKNLNKIDILNIVINYFLTVIFTIIIIFTTIFIYIFVFLLNNLNEKISNKFNYYLIEIKYYYKIFINFFKNKKN